MVTQEEGGETRDQVRPQSQSGDKGGVGDSAYTTHLRSRKVEIYAVTEDELTNIDTYYSWANALFAVASLALSGVLSVVLTWQTHCNWPLLGILCLVALASGGFGIWVHRTRTTLLKRIKNQTLPEDE